MSPVDERVPWRFLVGSWFLYDSFHYCTQQGDQADEWMHYATGVIVGEVRTIERMSRFLIRVQTPVYVEADQQSARNALIQMGDYGYHLHAVCHSHPGCGIEATQPSAVDYDHQLRLERGGYSVVSGIFSRDGYIRFFTGQHPFQIDVYGQGVTHIDRNIFHLTARYSAPGTRHPADTRG